VIKDATSGFPEKQITSNPKLKDKMRLTLIDSPGYGDKSDIKEWRKSISDELASRMYKYRQERLSVSKDYANDDRKRGAEWAKIPDSRVHLIFYFFDGHRSKD
jgi:septin family protein